MAQDKEIWIIDDHHLFSAGMKQMLTSVAGNHLIKSFSHPESANPEQERADIALIIVDFYIPGVDTLTWINHFSDTYPQTPVVVISSSTSPADKKQCISAGATAYYPKHAPPDITLKHLAHYIFDGENTDDTGLELAAAQHNLTARQVDILIQITRGHSNKKVAKLLGISPETVKTHLATIYKSIACDNRDEAVDWARSKGVV